jgi:hypothetical protein
MRVRTLLFVVAITTTAIATLVVGAAANAASPPKIRVDAPYTMTVRVLDETAGKYQVEIDNANPERFISAFNWAPPDGLTVVKITGTVGGICHLTTDGLVNCKGLASPAGSVTTMGGGILVNFTATGLQPTWAGSYWIHHGVVGSVAVTTSTFSDLPVCKKGQTSTKTNPCTKAQI